MLKMFYLKKVFRKILIILTFLIINQDLISSTIKSQIDTLEKKVEILFSKVDSLKALSDSTNNTLLILNDSIQKNYENIQSLEKTKISDHLYTIFLAIISGFIGAYFSFKFSRKLELKKYSNPFYSDINELISKTKTFQVFIYDSLNAIYNELKSDFSFNDIKIKDLPEIIEKISIKFDIKINQLTQSEFLELENRTNYNKLKQIMENYPDLDIIVSIKSCLNKYKSSNFLSNQKKRILIELEKSLIMMNLTFDSVEKQLKMLIR
jgi:hypothetical protein